MWHTLNEKPDSGRRIVALYNDGSGAVLYLVHDHGLLDQNGDDYSALDPNNVDRWAYLPDDVTLHFEQHVEHPTPY